MEPRHHLRCLGQPALFAPNGELIRFRTKKHLALLVYLAVESRRTHRRDRLAEFLWPNVRASEARHSLATGLSILRPRIGVDALETTREHVSLISGRLELDLDRLLEGDVLGEDTVSPLEVAAFLDGFEITDAPEFGLWKDRQQARLLPAIKDALVILIDRCRRTGDTRQIEQLADRMLALDELSEDAIRAKMEARAFAGDRLTALKIFEQWRVKLSQELGAAPSEMVEGMAVRLRRRGWERTTPADIPAVPTDQWRDRQFVGRANEYRVLYEAWEDIRRGLGAHLLVLGDSGIGKTTLVERLTTAAGLEGSVISRVQCYDLEQEIPYASVGGLIRGLLDRPGVLGTPPESLAELARTVPEIRRRFPSIPESLDSQGETARIRLTESFQDMLQAIAEEHPVILVVDDLHLADEASLAVLHLVMRRTEGQAIQVILIARPGELGRSPQVGRLRDSSRNLRMRELEVSPMNEQESQDLLRALVTPDIKQPSASAGRALVRAAAGFPMALELLYQDWCTYGDQSLALAMDAMTAELGGAGTPPHLYREVLERLVRALDPNTHGVLNLASLLGHRLNDIDLYSVAELSVGQTMTGMAELVSRRVLRDAGKGLEFVNELVRTAAYLGVPLPLRRVLHSNIADRLVARGNTESMGIEIAWHCMRAGRISEATPHLMRGAREAVRCGAPQEAERALASAIPSLHCDALEEASILLAEVLHEQGRGLQALDVLAGIDTSKLSERADHVVALIALARLSLGATARTCLQEQLPDLKRIVLSGSDTAVRAMAGRAMAYIVGETRDHQQANQLLDLLDSIPFSELDADALGQLALARALLFFNTGDSEKSFAQAMAGIHELTRRSAANLVMLQLQGGLGSIKLREGLYEEALAFYEHTLELANRLGNDRQVTLAIGNIALCCGRLGRYSDQLSWACRVPVAATPDFAGFVEIQLAYSQALAHALGGKPDLVLPIVIALDKRLIGAIPTWMLQAWAFWKADLLLLCKRREEAVAIARSALVSQDLVLGSSAFAGPYARWLCVTSQSTSERALAETILRQMASHVKHYDALDQVEIYCALNLITGNEERSEWKRELERRLPRLPGAIKSQLIALEVLS
jgi:DNA-binding SARP family transcriptional activator/tetratricopeptide (TPR) repeat protein